jgi:hypothetical protein
MDDPLETANDQLKRIISPTEVEGGAPKGVANSDRAQLLLATTKASTAAELPAEIVEIEAAATRLKALLLPVDTLAEHKRDSVVSSTRFPEIAALSSYGLEAVEYNFTNTTVVAIDEMNQDIGSAIQGLSMRVELVEGHVADSADAAVISLENSVANSIENFGPKPGSCKLL